MTGPDGEVSEKMTEQIERGFDSEGVECLVRHAGDDSLRGRVLIVKASTGLDSTTCTKSELVAST